MNDLKLLRINTVPNISSRNNFSFLLTPSRINGSTALLDFKGAFGGHAKLPSKYSPEEHRKAWMESRKNNGGVELRRSFLRILLATY